MYPKNYFQSGMNVCYNIYIYIYIYYKFSVKFITILEKLLISHIIYTR